MSINRVQETGFAQIANDALRDARLSFRARGILAMVLSHSGEWDAPRDWLVSQTEKEGREAVQTALNELTDLGYRVVTKERAANGTWRTVVGWFHTPIPRNPSPVDDDLVLGEGPTEGRVSRPPVHPTAGQPVGLPEHQSQNTNPLAQFSLIAAAPHGEANDFFSVFWKAYPRKVAKEDARKAFRAVTKDTTLTVILAGLERAKPGWTDPKYIPYPATWLRGRRWMDEAPAVSPPERKTNDLLIPPDNYR